MNSAPFSPPTIWTLSGQLSNDEPMRQFTLDISPFTVGRRADRGMTIPSPTVSGEHAEFLLDGEQLYVHDLGSTNGTFVNGDRVQDRCVVNHGDLVQFAQIVFRASRDAAATHHATVENNSADRALALIQFDKLMTERAVVPHFQPIVTIDDRTAIGYEILGRSRLFGLSDPQTMFMAAAVLNLEAELSRIFRVEGIREGHSLPLQQTLFVNTHPNEINDLELLEFSLRELREMAPERPIILEIHEATATKTTEMRELRAALTDLDMGLAYDDFGAGQARLVELVDVPPDYLKFDMQLVQGIAAASPDRQTMVQRLVQMTRDLGIQPLAEGIELEEDHLFCQEMGFSTAQGFIYGKPMTAKAVQGEEAVATS
ncbi:MAG: EAL domain-containing protein [Aeoliella sp.]